MGVQPPTPLFQLSSQTETSTFVCTHVSYVHMCGYICMSFYLYTFTKTFSQYNTFTLVDISQSHNQVCVLSYLFRSWISCISNFTFQKYTKYCKNVKFANSEILVQVFNKVLMLFFSLRKQSQGRGGRAANGYGGHFVFFIVMLINVK